MTLEASFKSLKASQGKFGINPVMTGQIAEFGIIPKVRITSKER